MEERDQNLNSVNSRYTYERTDKARTIADFSLEEKFLMIVTNWGLQRSFEGEWELDVEEEKTCLFRILNIVNDKCEI